MAGIAKKLTDMDAGTLSHIASFLIVQPLPFSGKEEKTNGEKLVPLGTSSRTFDSWHNNWVDTGAYDLSFLDI